MARRGGKEQVELVEAGSFEDAAFENAAFEDDDGAEPGAEFPGEGGAAEERPRWHGIRRAWPFAVVALVVAGAYLVTGTRERAAVEARHDALRGQQAFAGGLERAPDHSWEVDLGSRWVYPVVVDDTLLLATDPGGAVALDIATGAERWRIGAEENQRTLCGLLSDEPVSSEGTVDCFEQRFSVSDEGDWTELGSTLQRRDVLTGEVRSERLWPEGLAHVTPWRDAVLVVDSGASSTVLRLEAMDGAEQWSLQFLDEPLGDEEYVSVSVRGDHGVVVGRDRALVVDFAGEVVLDETSALWGTGEDAYSSFDGGGVSMPELDVRLLDGGGWTVSSWNLRPERTYIFDPLGKPAFDVDGAISELELDDGSVGYVLLRRDDTVVELLDRATGDARFTLDRFPDGPSFLLDGVLVASTGTQTRAIDVATGEELWSTAIDGQLVASDGAVVVVYESLPGPSQVRAFDLATGVEKWNLGLSSPEAQVFTLADALFVFDDGTFARLGS